MPMTRLPRMLLSLWLDNKRPQQRPPFNYGHDLGRHLGNAGVTTGPLWRVTAKYGTPLPNKRMFTVTPTAVAISGSTQNSWLKRLPRILYHHRSPTLESCLAYYLCPMRQRLLSPQFPRPQSPTSQTPCALPHDRPARALLPLWSEPERAS